jgi:hypothetical protein
MKNAKWKFLMITCLGLMMSLQLFAQREERVEKAYADKDEVNIKLVLGDCHIGKSNDNRIHVHLVYTYSDDQFEPKFKERGRKLTLEEKFHGDNPRGYSSWTVDVPEGMEIDFKSATGDLLLEGIDAEIDGNTGTGEIEIREAKGEFDLNTGTGNVDVTNSEGEFDLNSGTGNVRLENAKGNFDANSGTGDVEASNITIEYEGDFNSGTGDVEVVSPKGEDFDLTVSSGTDDAVLIMKGSPIEGYFEFTSHARKGRIDSPVKFDEEEEYWQGDNEYVRKSFTKGKETPRFYIKTGTGRAVLKR